MAWLNSEALVRAVNSPGARAEAAVSAISASGAASRTWATAWRLARSERNSELPVTSRILPNGFATSRE